MKLTTTLNLTKYNRIFLFGCSFTYWHWDTWADFILKHNKDKKDVYNFGWAGVGNTYIFNKFIEVNAKYEFTKNDLVIIMWAPFNREDRYFNDKWNHYPEILVEDAPIINRKYSDTYGFLRRDITYIDATMRILKANECDWDILSVEDYTNLYKILDPLVREKAKKLFDLHRNTMNGIRTPYYLEIYDQKQEDPTTMITSHRKMLKGKKVRVRIDRHPTPRRHIEYLRTIYSNILNEDKTITNKMCRESDRLLRDGLIMDASRPSYRPNDM